MLTLLRRISFSEASGQEIAVNDVPAHSAPHIGATGPCRDNRQDDGFRRFRVGRLAHSAQTAARYSEQHMNIYCPEEFGSAISHRSEIVDVC